MTETPTVASLDMALRQHQRDCMTETRLTRVAIESLNTSVQHIVDRLDSFNKTAWKAVGAVCMVILGSVASFIMADINAHHTATVQAQAAAQIVATTAKTTSTQNKTEILNAIAAK